MTVGKNKSSRKKRGLGDCPQDFDFVFDFDFTSPTGGSGDEVPQGFYFIPFINKERINFDFIKQSQKWSMETFCLNSRTKPTPWGQSLETPFFS
ncbi:MAG: hypothetical protein HQL81_04560 [Magnetococcales bacterium]|nr:hypothetical protein [Magnetococcales bacterium]